MASTRVLKEKELVGGHSDTTVFPITIASAVKDSRNRILQSLIDKYDRSLGNSASALFDLHYVSGSDSVIEYATPKSLFSKLETNKIYFGGTEQSSIPAIEIDGNHLKVTGDLVVTGNVVAYQSGDYVESTILDAIKGSIDPETLGIIDGRITVIGGVGGVSNWDDLKGKPSWIGSSKPAYSTSEITGMSNYATVTALGEKANKATTLAGYNITDGVNSLTINGSGNVVTTATLSNHSLTLTKGSTMASKSDLDAFVTQFNSLFEVVGTGADAYIKAKKSFVSVGDIVAWQTGNVLETNIFENIPFNPDIFTWDSTNKRWTIDGKIGGATTWEELLNKPSWVTSIGSANTVLAAPNGSSGSASFRKLVTADLPNDLKTVYAAGLDGGVPYTGSGLLNLNARTDVSGYRSYIGALTMGNTWYNMISCRHRNGSSDGNKYGMYITSSLTTIGDLLWNKQCGGTLGWQGERVLLDSNNYKTYCTPSNIGAMEAMLFRKSGYDFYKTVVALIELKSNGGIAAGTIIMCRNNGLFSPSFIEYVLTSKYNTTGAPHEVCGNVICNGKDYPVVTFTYGGKYYGGIMLYKIDAQEDIRISSKLGMTPLIIDYYRNKSSTFEAGVLNQEVYDSISTTTRVATERNVHAVSDAAIKLNTARTLWGNSFDGTAGINGNITLGAGAGGRIYQIRNTGHTKFNAPATESWSTGANIHKSDDTPFNNSPYGTYGTGGELQYHFYGGTYNSPKMVLLPSGNFGINRIDPIEKLDVGGNIRTNSVYPSSNHAYNLGKNGYTYERIYGRYYDTDSTYAMRLCTSGVQRVHIREDKAFVGIDTTDPKGSLHVNGNLLAKCLKSTNLCIESDSNGDFISDYSGEINRFNGALYLQHHVNGNLFLCAGGGDIILNSKNTQIRRNGCGSEWIKGRDNALVYINTADSYSTLGSIKSTNGSWQIGHYNGVNWADYLLFTYITDANYNSNTNTVTAHIKFSAGGDIIAGGEVTAYSDIRLKSDIKNLSYRGSIRPVTYIKDGKPSIGFIAQEVRKLYPELVIGEETEDSYLSLNYPQYTAVLQAGLNNVEEEIKKLKEEISFLKEKVCILENKNN